MKKSSVLRMPYGLSLMKDLLFGKQSMTKKRRMLCGKKILTTDTAFSNFFKPNKMLSMQQLLKLKLIS